ncbi:DUF4811 domain-containing protein [Lactococcus fujiensis]|uniref:DUF4811 domain-containing protein n=1 Tax=Lactococcus fujiensis JCM 16395 TaxID=1291764 RepID=A0A2A5RNF5_9LACT|nr:DUF4811 domain-containing protein [Lactococcus fujiensis]PCS00896.1 hypothetical protein RT41_GL000686 [Lactococcus fujiensis JCM 16395]
MIIIILAILVLLTFYSFIFIENKTVRWVAGIISFVLLLTTVIGLTYQITDKWAMKEVTSAKTKEIYTAGETNAPYGMMIKAEIGKDTNNYVLVYRNDEKSKKPDSNFVPDQNHIIETLKKTATYKIAAVKTASVTTTTTRRVFKNDFWKLIFGVGGEQNELVKQHSVVTVPKDTWLVLTQDQVKKLTEEAPAMQAKMEAALKADPEKAMQMAALQKSDPVAYAKLQVEQIKQLLGITE